MVITWEHDKWEHVISQRSSFLFSATVFVSCAQRTRDKKEMKDDKNQKGYVHGTRKKKELVVSCLYSGRLVCKKHAHNSARKSSTNVSSYMRVKPPFRIMPQMVDSCSVPPNPL
ncbi:unnamed protein product [Ixodes persulcatus]